MKVELGFIAHNFAKKFASEQSSSENRKQVFINTLAVYAVREYLSWLNISLDLDESEIWNPILRYYLNTPSLLIPGLGAIICVPFVSNQEISLLPSESIEQVIGYIGVRILDDFNSADILGYTKIASENINLKDLSPIEEFISTFNLEVVPLSLSNWDSETNTTSLETNWLPIKPPSNLLFIDPEKEEVKAASAFDNTEAIERGKIFYFPNIEEEYLIAISPRLVANNIVKALFEVRTLKQNQYLPLGSKLMLISSDNKEIRKREVKKQNKKLNFQENLTVGKSFQLEFIVGKESVRISFKI